MNTVLSRRTANVFLAVILLATAMVWIQACRITYVSDDFLLDLHTFAPMTSVRDIAECFTSPAVNYRYWRPVPSGLTIADFLLWGWDGRGFHLTNLIVHLLSVCLAFLVVRDVFGRPPLQALAATLLFGVAASHEGNIVWPPGRTDSIATLFVFLLLISERKAREIGTSSRARADGATVEGQTRLQRRGAAWSWRASGVACFLVAVASKEVAVFALPFLMVMPDGTWNARRRIVGILPYVAAAALFFLYRRPFVEPLSSTPILAGDHSPGALAMNAVYAFGYTVIPLDLDQALSLINEHRTILVFLSVAACVLIAAFCIYVVVRDRWRGYLVPFAYTAATGAFTVVAFERWRVYMMSIGVFTLLVMAVVDLTAPSRGKTRRVILAAGMIALVLFNVARALSAQTVWYRASELRRSLQADLGRVLEEHPTRPVTFLFLDRPAKLGSAPLIQLAVRDVLSQAELERLNSPRLATGGMRVMTVDHQTATTLLALDEKRGFEGLHWKRMGETTYEVWVEGNPGLVIVPAIRKTKERAERDQAYAEGDTLRSAFADVILFDSRRTSATRVRITVRDTTMVPLLFDGERFIPQTVDPR